MSTAKRTISGGVDAQYQKTLDRLSRIQSHLKTAPRTGRLKDKVCIVTGVGSLKGIGRATAILFAHEGARHLYLLDYIGDNLPELKQTIETRYPDVKVTVHQADASDEKAISNICKQALEEEGRLDVFFANAGIAKRGDMNDISNERFMEVMRINALSVFLAIKYASHAMSSADPSKSKSESGGSIILTASVAGIRSGGGPIDYSASKAAVNNMAKTAANELTRTNIRVNSICPGLVETGMTGSIFDTARTRGTEGKIGQLNPLQRYAVPEEIAQGVLFLASDESSYVNGQNITIDGGLSSTHPFVRNNLRSIFSTN